MQWDARLIPVEQDAKDRCGLLLFVISGETLSVASMVEAAYYIGCGRKVVLCLSDITPGAEVEGMKVGVGGGGGHVTCHVMCVMCVCHVIQFQGVLGASLSCDSHFFIFHHDIVIYHVIHHVMFLRMHYVIMTSPPSAECACSEGLQPRSCLPQQHCQQERGDCLLFPLRCPRLCRQLRPGGGRGQCRPAPVLPRQ